MATNPAGKDIPTRTRRETLVAFSPAAVAAPFPLRCGALLADYVVVIFLPAAFLLISRASGNDGASLINSGLNDIGWLSGTMLALVSGILLPIATGRTIGKFATGLRVVMNDGSEPTIKRMVLRQALAILLFPLTLGLSFFIAAFSPTGRSLHDYAAGTMVIFAEKRPA
jgi:uncharacterized RDD family membrane protein YckC